MNSDGMEAKRPLAERMRPTRLDDFIGQEHVTGQSTAVRHAIAQDKLFSMILWGPPGCGKTTLAGIFAQATASHFIHFSAVLSGVKEIREVIAQARDQARLFQRRTILFVDEIHRFNKSQQDAFLHHVESGLITLIGATTENPSFEVIPPLLSRCQVITLNRLRPHHLEQIIRRALANSEKGLGSYHLEMDNDAMAHLIRVADGDARYALNGLEIAAAMVRSENKDKPPDVPQPRITLAIVEKVLQTKALMYDKSGESHYNLISALHKSLRGSDPDAALYWLARMLESGEDPLYIARRMVRFASEDVGNADPYALRMAISAMEAFRFLGHPEGDLALAHAAVYLATAPKSNAIYTAFGKVKQTIKKSGALPVPMHIRNAPTKLMKDLGYGHGYAYDHDFPEALAPQHYLPEPIRNEQFYLPTDRGYEQIIKKRLDRWRQLRNQAPDTGSSHPTESKNEDI